MKLTKQKLVQIINEELENTLSEMRASQLSPFEYAKKAGENAGMRASTMDDEQLKKMAKEEAAKIIKLLKKPNELGRVFLRDPFGAGRDVVIKQLKNLKPENLESYFIDGYLDKAGDVTKLTDTDLEIEDL